MELINSAKARYIENAPNSIGFLVFLYGPETTRFFVFGLISIFPISTGPPSPIVIRPNPSSLALSGNNRTKA